MENHLTPNFSFMLVFHSPSSTISPANTFEIPDMAITTFWDTDDPVMD